MKRGAALTIAVASASALADGPKPARPKQRSAEMQAEARKHMKAGWAAQKAKKWPDAVKEFEAALKIIDGDARALAELGWSAMNAGDNSKAATADRAAVAAATDPKVKAASLYNLALAYERMNSTASARDALVASLELRPNDTVAAELAKLGGPATTGACPAGKAASARYSTRAARSSPTIRSTRCARNRPISSRRWPAGTSTK